MKAPPEDVARWTKLKYVAELRRDKAQASDSTLRYIGLEHVESETGRLLPGAFVVGDDTREASQDGSSAEEAFGIKFSIGDVLFCKLRPYLAKVWVAEFDGLCSTEFLVLRPAEVESSYLKFAMLRRQFIDAVNASTFGAKMPRADWDFIGGVRIPVLGEDIRRERVGKLERELDRVDSLLLSKRRQLELLAEKRRALITRAVTKGLNPNAPMRDSGIPWLGKIPAHWKTPPVSARYDVQLGKMLDEKRMARTTLAPYLRNVDVQWEQVNVTDLPEMDFDEAERLRFRLRFGDLLICEGGEVGRCAIWSDELAECYYQKALHRLRPMTSEDIPQFFVYTMSWLVNSGVLRGLAEASTIQHLPAEKLRSIRYPSPPEAEQQQIVVWLAEHLRRLDDLSANVQTTLQLLHERRGAAICQLAFGWNSGSHAGQLTRRRNRAN